MNEFLNQVKGIEKQIKETEDTIFELRKLKEILLDKREVLIQENFEVYGWDICKKCKSTNCYRCYECDCFVF